MDIRGLASAFASMASSGAAPVLTLILGRTVLKEKLTKKQVLGASLAIAGTILTSLP